MRRSVFLLCASVLSTVAVAQPTSPPLSGPTATGRTWGFIGSLDGLTARFEHGSANAAGVGSRGWGLAFNFAATVKSVLLLGADLGAAFVGDDSSFTQSTTGGQKESSTAAFFGSAYTGLKTPSMALNDRKTAFAVLGVALGVSSWSGTRSIDHCVDCREEDVRFRGGSYVEPFVMIGPASDVGFTGLKLAFRSYSASDATVKNMIFIGIGGVRGR